VVVDVLPSRFSGVNQETKRSYCVWFLMHCSGFTYLIGELHGSRYLVFQPSLGLPCRHLQEFPSPQWLTPKGFTLLAKTFLLGRGKPGAAGSNVIGQEDEDSDGCCAERNSHG
jgi:hypothetical protein